MSRVLAPALLAGLLLAASPATALQEISRDPYTNPDSQHATQVEPDTFAFGSTVVAAFQSGRYFDGGASNVGFATSLDGGVTWTDGFLPATTLFATPPGPYARVSDPAVAYDARHDVWMISTLAINASVRGVAVLTSRSTDGGLTWGAPVVVSAAGPGSFYDKNWIACDNSPASPFYGNCYATWDDFGLGDLLLTSTSSDGGLTWGPERTTRNGATGLGGQPLVQPGGKVIVPVLNAFATQILAYRSRNGGASWTATRVVSSITTHDPAGNLRSLPLPSAAMDAAGTVYVVWQDCRFRAGCASNDIVMSTSRNGRRWTAPVRIPIDPVTSGVDHFIPGLDVDPTTAGPTARIALTYYFYPDAGCTQQTCQLMVGSISSGDGGTTWSLPRTLAGPMRLTDLASTSQGFMVGDYISTSFSGGSAVPAFAVAGPRVGTVFDEATFAAVLPVTSAQAFPLAVAPDPVVTFQDNRAPRTEPIYWP